MSEQSIAIPIDAKITLEARFVPGTLPKAAVTCHPHPLYGGRMDNNVVLAVQGAPTAEAHARLQAGGNLPGGSRLFEGLCDEAAGRREHVPRCQQSVVRGLVSRKALQVDGGRRRAAAHLRPRAFPGAL